MFHECLSLESVYIPDSVTTIGHNAFADCHLLCDVVGYNGLITIGSDAFRCTSLSNITLPACLSTIGSDAFANALNAINYKGTMAQWKTISFGNIYDQISYVYCSDGTINVDEEDY